VGCGLGVITAPSVPVISTTSDRPQAFITDPDIKRENREFSSIHPRFDRMAATAYGARPDFSLSPALPY